MPRLTCGFAACLTDSPNIGEQSLARVRVRARACVWVSAPKTVKTVRRERETGTSTSENACLAIRLTSILPWVSR